MGLGLELGLGLGLGLGLALDRAARPGGVVTKAFVNMRARWSSVVPLAYSKAWPGPSVGVSPTTPGLPRGTWVG